MVDYIKLQEITELRNALTIKELNEELLEHLQLSMMYILRYCEKHSVPLPNLETITKLLDRADSLIYQLRNEGKVPLADTTNTHFSTPKHDTHEDDRTIIIIIITLFI